ncbi:MAG: hypothetical protein HC802_05460 [Caldilineaceae bacterium]|nr:hypothetical protein [Caldilineaceae bacterium]
MKLKSLKSLLGTVLVMALLSACIAPMPPQASDSDTHASSANAESEHEHTHEAGQLEELGEVTFPVSCTPKAQVEFSHAVAFLHSFWFDAAIDSFNHAAELDPSCAMAHWGVAMSLLGIPWSPRRNRR